MGSRGGRRADVSTWAGRSCTMVGQGEPTAPRALARGGRAEASSDEPVWSRVAGMGSQSKGARVVPGWFQGKDVVLHRSVARGRSAFGRSSYRCGRGRQRRAERHGYRRGGHPCKLDEFQATGVRFPGRRA